MQSPVAITPASHAASRTTVGAIAGCFKIALYVCTEVGGQAVNRADEIDNCCERGGLWWARRQPFTHNSGLRDPPRPASASISATSASGRRTAIVFMARV